MKKKSLWIFLPLLALSFLFLGSLNSGAVAAEKVQLGGTLTYMDLYPTLNPMTWDIDDWNWKHGYDTRFLHGAPAHGGPPKGPKGVQKDLLSQ